MHHLVLSFSSSSSLISFSSGEGKVFPHTLSVSLWFACEKATTHHDDRYGIEFRLVCSLVLDIDLCSTCVPGSR